MTISFSGNLVIGSNGWDPKAQLKFGTLIIGRSDGPTPGFIIWEEDSSGEIIGPTHYGVDEIISIDRLFNSSYIVLD